MGDSITQGCFELVEKNDGKVTTLFDRNNSYHNYFNKILAILFPTATVNIINAGISGETALDGLKRLERDVISYNPDLTVVAFGLNDCLEGIEYLTIYKKSLKSIFTQLKDAGSEVVFMTENIMADKLSWSIKDNSVKDIAEKCISLQKDGTADIFFKEAINVAEECGVKVCDVYSKWKMMNQNGVNTTELLSNKINHPRKEFHWIFAYELISTIMSN